MLEYHVRVTEFDGSCKEAVLAILQKYTSQHYCVYEVGSVTEKPHYQAYCIIDEGRLSSMKKAVSRIYDDRKGNEVYSMSVVRKDKEVLLRYLSKGTKDSQPVVVSQNMDIDPLQYNIEYWAENEEIQERKAKRQKTSTNVELLEEALEKIKADGIGYEDKARIVRQLARTWREHGKIINMYRARDFYYEIAARMCPNEQMELLMYMKLTEKF